MTGREREESLAFRVAGEFKARVPASGGLVMGYPERELDRVSCVLVAREVRT